MSRPQGGPVAGGWSETFGDDAELMTTISPTPLDMLTDPLSMVDRYIDAELPPPVWAVVGATLASAFVAGFVIVYAGYRWLERQIERSA